MMSPDAIKEMDTTGRDHCSTDPKTKQQRKEEGRRRALEIALAKQQLCDNPSDYAATQRRTGKRANRKSARHGARNQHRHKHFAKWILERFPHVLEECTDRSASNDDSTQQMHILDVAGGKGELSARLSLCHSLRVMMVDPRPADVASVYTNTVVPKLPNKWQKSIEERLMKSPTFVQDELDKRFAQLAIPFVDPNQCAAPGETNVLLDAAVRNASLLVGLHADGATEAIVDAALSYGKPFVVVPCCVFPNLFRERYITVPIDGTACESSKEISAPLEKRVPVRTHDQFCKYLLSKDPRFVTETLSFEGRNTAIWWNGK